MPRTAATQDSNRLYNRQSAKLRAAPNMPQKTPVLFRLPAIEQVLPVPVAAPAVANDLAPTDLPQAAISSLTNNSHTSPVPAPVAETAPAPTVFNVAEKQTAAAAQPERSWWEHWSSGVVLILLIIALIAASIIAFNDGGGTDPDLLAEVVDEPASQSVGDLTGMSIPSLPVPIEVSSQLPPASPREVASQLAPESLVLAVPNPVETAVERSEGGLVLGNGEMESLTQTQEDASTNETASSTKPMTASTANVELLPDLVGIQLQENANQPMASLESPIGMAATQPAVPSLISHGLEIPVPEPQVQEPQVHDAQAHSNLSAMPPLPAPPETAGASPSLYDNGLLLQGDQAASTSVNPVAANNSQAQLDTNLPSYSAILAGGSSAAPNISLASQPTSVPPATSVPGIRKTATPESSADAIIRAWQEFHALNQAESSPTNRYPPTAPGAGQN
jgi:hypothetical protein